MIALTATGADSPADLIRQQGLGLLGLLGAIDDRRDVGSA